MRTTRAFLPGCAWAALIFFLSSLLAPEEALSFDTDALKTAGIVSGITLGVALIIVLVVGTVRDAKKDKRDEPEEEDVWSGSPVLKTLGFRHWEHPLFAPSPQPEEAPGTFCSPTRSPLRTACRAANPAGTSITYLDGECGAYRGQGSIGQGGTLSNRSTTTPCSERNKISRER